MLAALVSVAFCESVSVVALVTEAIVVPVGIPVPTTFIPGKRLFVLDTVTCALPVVIEQFVRVCCGTFTVRVPLPDLISDVTPVMGAPVNV